MGHAMSDQIPDRVSQTSRRPARKRTAWLWLMLIGVVTVAWLAGLAWAAIWLIQLALS
jgi:flagellar basal body-associated protein FliL